MSRRSLALAPAIAVLGLASVAVPSCSAREEAPPRRDCRSLIWARPKAGADVRVVGSWNDWEPPGATLWPIGNEGWRVLPLLLPAGEYGYRLVQDGKSALDPLAPLGTYQGELEASLLIAPDCAVPLIEVRAVTVDDGGTATIDAAFLTAGSGSPLDPSSLAVTEEGGAPVASPRGTAGDGRLSFTTGPLPPGKHLFTIDASDRAGAKAEPVRVAAWVKPAARSWADGVLYQIMLDRYRGDGGAALSPPAALGARAGGTLDGVRAEIDKGTFDALGVSALWLSPVYVNPIEPRIGRDGHPSEGYHGYWPIDDRAVDPRLGGEPALRALVASAHARGLRVLLDIVPNHVYESNPRYQEHQGDGWFNEGASACVCGTPDCDWGAHIQTCWFAPYLPDVRWQRPDAIPLAADDARFWIEAFGVDGVRVDAVPMMPRAATRRIVHTLRTMQSPRGDLFSIGEVFTGPGAGGLDAIRYHLGPDGLDAAFDFPLMWAMRDAIATDRQGLDAIESILVQKEKALAGSGSLLGLMIDNHDTSRFLSEAAGNGNVDPWASPPAQPTEPALYQRQAMALGLIFALPGLPVLYYGDELALAGANDPDNRRVMPTEATLLPEQQAVLAVTRRLGALRRCFPALRTGARRALTVTPQRWAFVRDAGDGLPVIAVLAKKAATMAIPGAPAGDYVDGLTGTPLSVSEGSLVPMDPLSFRILVPAQHPCP